MATSEGYAYPGGAQRKFHAEVADAEEQHHLQATVQAFRDFKAGVQPAGPGARGLLDTFAAVDAALADAAGADPAVLASDRYLENLLRKRAATLHIGPANFCWLSKTLDNQQ